jgi:hypothetical protein
VPIFATALELSRARSSSPWIGRIRGVFSAIISFSVVIFTPISAMRAISSSSAQGSSTTPLPMTLSLPSRRIPDGNSDSL